MFPLRANPDTDSTVALSAGSVRTAAAAAAADEPLLVGRDVSLHELFSDPALVCDHCKLPLCAPHCVAHIPQGHGCYVFERSRLNALLLFLTKPSADALYIVGPVGCGKTSLVLETAARLQWPVESVNVTAHTKLSSLMGSYQRTGSAESSFVSGPLERAVRYGEILLLNDGDALDDSVLGALKEALDSGRLTLPDHTGEVIRVHPFFRVIATSSIFAGHLADHFECWRFLECGYPQREIEQAIIEQAVPGINSVFVERVLHFAAEIRFNSSSYHLCAGDVLFDISSSLKEFRTHVRERAETVCFATTTTTATEIVGTVGAPIVALCQEQLPEAEAGAVKSKRTEDNTPKETPLPPQMPLPPLPALPLQQLSVADMARLRADTLTALRHVLKEPPPVVHHFTRAQQQHGLRSTVIGDTVVSSVVPLNRLFADGEMSCNLPHIDKASELLTNSGWYRYTDPLFSGGDKLSTALSTRTLLRICRLYASNEQISVQEAITMAFGSSLSLPEYEFVLRLSYDVFGYGGEFYQQRHCGGEQGQ